MAAGFAGFFAKFAYRGTNDAAFLSSDAESNGCLGRLAIQKQTGSYCPAIDAAGSVRQISTAVDAIAHDRLPGNFARALAGVTVGARLGLHGFQLLQ
jgi:hypothetical protein